MKLKLLGIALLCVASYFAGRLTAPRGGEESLGGTTVPTNQSLLDREKSRLASARSLFDAAPTYERNIDAKHALSQMNAEELEALWESHKDTFDYNDPDDGRLAADLLRRLAKLDPQAALSKIAEARGAKYAMLAAVYEGWAETDPEGALAQIRQETDKRARHGGLTAIIEQVGRNDRQAAVELFEASVADKSYAWNAWDGMSGFFNNWARDAPQEALDSALKLNGTTRAKAGLWGGIQGWAKTDGAAAAKWIDANLSKHLVREGTVKLAQSWADVDPKAAANFMFGKHDLTANDEVRRWSHSTFGQGMWNVLDRWSDSNFTEAAAWIDGIDDPELKREFQENVLSMANDREAALAYALERIDEPVMLESVVNRAEGFGRDGDVAAGLAWAKENLKNPEHLKQFEKEMVDGLLWWRPSEAVEHLERLSDGKEKTDRYGDAGERWARNQPEEAKAWLDELPPGEERDAATLGLAEGWLDNDLETAEKWIKTIENEDLHDQLTDRHSRALMDRKNIDRSIEIAQQIADPHLREQTMEGILMTWFRDEAKSVAARDYIQNTDLVSENVRWRLLNRRVAR